MKHLLKVASISLKSFKRAVPLRPALAVLLFAPLAALTAADQSWHQDRLAPLAQAGVPIFAKGYQGPPLHTMPIFANLPVDGKPKPDDPGVRTVKPGEIPPSDGFGSRSISCREFTMLAWPSRCVRTAIFTIAILKP